MKTRSSSPNLSKLARADISCQFMKTRLRHCLQNECKFFLSELRPELEGCGEKVAISTSFDEFPGRTWFLNAAEAEVDEDKYGDRRSC